ncbi:BamA/TamA family outer membrane protein [Desulfovibrio sp. JC010]|uniref:BamA/TamA family outer membrane protein n=1 Tax=Desulfovibrio sp. JC010 TaxID=2593641 RepID=UPI0013D69E81|nr:BamA/TamA family outer membrane protein [Desulfovibrio sp. JC010]NDV27818.1 BamA/TamA family outer membrane protein [Desulfovibrio sp. JC010]
MQYFIKTYRTKVILLATIAFCCLLFTGPLSHAQQPTFGPALLHDVDQPEEKNKEKRSLIMPYAFRSDQIGFAGGIAASMSGFQDGQMSIAGTAYASGKEALSFIGSVSNARMPFTDRLFLDFITLDGTYPDLWVYDAPQEDPRGGSNDSQKSDRYRGRGIDNMFEATFKYALPWGKAADNPIITYNLKDGLPVEQQTSAWDEGWNPLENGLTYLEFTPFYRHQDVDDGDGQGKHHYKGIGARLGIRYDNTDFPLSPSSGSKQRLQLSQGFDGLTHSDAWTSLEFEYGKFFSLGESDMARQRVIALGFWTSAVASDQKPPPWEGATLGGRYRMRGFDDNRFWDKAAIYYSAEYRYIPKWNPLKDLKIVKVDWLQFILFGEMGRVAPRWSLTELHTDMKYDAGFGLAAFVNKYLGRMDWAFSGESWHVRVGVSQSF